MPRLTYLIGEPGVGKTTLVTATMVEPIREIPRPFAHRIDATGLRVLGPAGTPPFGGTDRLSMSVQPKVLEWLNIEAPSRVLGEGDRLANLSFLQGAAALGYDVTLAHLSCDTSVAEKRRAERAAEFGLGAQNATWVQGRRTKITNLLARWADTGGRLIVLDGSLPTNMVAGCLQTQTQ